MTGTWKMVVINARRYKALLYTPPTVVRFSGTRSCGDIDDFNFFNPIF